MSPVLLTLRASAVTYISSEQLVSRLDHFRGIEQLTSGPQQSPANTTTLYDGIASDCFSIWMIVEK